VTVTEWQLTPEAEHLLARQWRLSPDEVRAALVEVEQAVLREAAEWLAGLGQRQAADMLRQRRG